MVHNMEGNKKIALRFFAENQKWHFRFSLNFGSSASDFQRFLKHLVQNL